MEKDRLIIWRLFTDSQFGLHAANERMARHLCRHLPTTDAYNIRPRTIHNAARLPRRIAKAAL
jgi:hypothetical protein